MEIEVAGASPAPAAKPLAGQLATGAVDASAYAAFATEATEVSTDTMAALSAMAEELVTCEQEIVDAMAAVIRAKNALADVQEKRLPSLMENYGLDTFKFTDRTTGLKRTIELVKKWAVAMPPKTGKTADPEWQTKHDAIYAWLVEIGSGAVIKKDMVTPLGLMPDEEAKKIMQAFKDANPELEITFEKKVEPATLTKLISGKKDAGEQVHEFVKVTPVREARVKAGTTRAAKN